MCLLMVTLGELPTREQLYTACKSNPDGFGFAVNHGDRIVTGRSMKYERLIERFFDEMGKTDGAVGMFHARYTTHGTTTIENNHPFRVDGRHDTVLAHNGVLPITPRAGDSRSDTRIFAEDLLGSIGLEQLDSTTGFKTLEKFIGASKVAIMTNAPELRDSIYILNEELGHWQGDIWWSNYGYVEYNYSYHRPYSTWDSQAWRGQPKAITVGGDTDGNWWNDPDAGIDDVSDNILCEVCLSVLSHDDFMAGICNVCDCCIDCSEHYNTCMCYTPEVAQKNKVQNTGSLVDGLWEH